MGNTAHVVVHRRRNHYTLHTIDEQSRPPDTERKNTAYAVKSFRIAARPSCTTAVRVCPEAAGSTVKNCRITLHNSSHREKAAHRWFYRPMTSPLLAYQPLMADTTSNTLQKRWEWGHSGTTSSHWGGENVTNNWTTRWFPPENWWTRIMQQG